MADGRRPPATTRQLRLRIPLTSDFQCVLSRSSRPLQKCYRYGPWKRGNWLRPVSVGILNKIRTCPSDWMRDFEEILVVPALRTCSHALFRLTSMRLHFFLDVSLIAKLRSLKLGQAGRATWRGIGKNEYQTAS